MKFDEEMEQAAKKIQNKYRNRPKKSPKKPESEDIQEKKPEFNQKQGILLMNYNIHCIYVSIRRKRYP